MFKKHTHTHACKYTCQCGEKNDVSLAVAHTQQQQQQTGKVGATVLLFRLRAVGCV